MEYLEKEDGQMIIEGLNNLEDKEETSETVLSIVSEVFNSSTSNQDIQNGLFKLTPLPKNLNKGRSELLDDIIPVGEKNNTQDISIENVEVSEITQMPMATRISLSFFGDHERGVSCSNKLTNFDREVIDAVSTLAVSHEIMTAAMIYRMITGKKPSVKLVPAQTKRVEESMMRCASCQVRIDLSPELNSLLPSKNNQNEQLSYTGSAISFEAIEHKNKSKTTTFYKIHTIPPFVLFAEKLGKISQIPLELLDTPVSKTDDIIAVQSYLLRVIEASKKRGKDSVILNWSFLFEVMSAVEGKSGETKVNRTKGVVLKMLDYWKKLAFITDYEAKPWGKEVSIKFQNSKNFPDPSSCIEASIH